MYNAQDNQGTEGRVMCMRGVDLLRIVLSAVRDDIDCLMNMHT